jgi:RNA polymerase sigma-70 factor (ECF subfamily)
VVGGRFQTTRWSIVLQAGEGEPGASREALAELCEAYWYPAYAFVRGQGHAEDEARDLTQSYFAALLDKGFLRDLRPELGRFRSFLLVSIRNFLHNERDRERAAKRGGGAPPVSLDVEVAERRLAGERSSDLSPERGFEVRWALTVVRRAMRRLEQELTTAGQEERFRLLRGFLVGDAPSLSYAEIAGRLDLTENAVKSMVRRLRRRYGVVLRAEVAQTIGRREDVDEELRHLLRTLESR